MPENKHRARTAAQTSAAFAPFADAAGVRTIGALSFENGTDRIAMHGTLDLTRDRTGLAPGPAAPGDAGRHRDGAGSRRSPRDRGRGPRGDPDVGPEPVRLSDPARRRPCRCPAGLILETDHS